MTQRDKSERGSSEQTPLRVIAGLVLVVAAIATWYGAIVPGGGYSSALLFLGVAAAALLVGGVVGFLFGIPRFSSGIGAQPHEPKPNATPASTSAAGSSPDASQSIAAGVPATRNPGVSQASAASGTAVVSAPGTSRGYRPSTNLDDVADWLTKIIVGVGLTQLKGIGTGIISIADNLVLACNANCGQAKGFIEALLVFCAIAGFLFGYLWTRLDYARLAAQSDVRTDQTLRDVEKQSIDAIGIGGGTKLAIASGALAEPLLPGEGVAADVRRGEPVNPNKGQFGGRAVANGRALRATINPAESRPDYYRITLTVASTVPTKPLVGTVVFFLHPTFRDRVVVQPVVNGVATLVIVAYGAFTVGATADGEETKLELDLAENPDAPDDFKAR